MFSFHKPKIYRSLKGCCICRAKSSSSRFTDSKRYEGDFEKCFRMSEKRAGEICNACVLLVKRWKKLPPGSNRNWHHVVDARAGPGTKSIMKMKNRNREEQRLKKKHKHKKQLRHSKPPQSPGGLSDDVIIGDDCQSDDSHSNASSPIASDLSDDEGAVAPRTQSAKSRSGRRKKHHPKPMRFSSFLDLTYWKKTEICCGIIFKGANGEVLVDTKLLRPCRTCKPLSPQCSVSDDLLSLSPAAPTEEAQQPMEHEEDIPSPSPPPSSTGTQSSEDSCDTVLDLSLPHRRKNSPLEATPRCIEMEV